MQIGEKIKSIRTSKVMTQKQLAGDFITRNMLSRIENGAATPSLQTVYYLAGRLNVSPGFLLAEGEDEEMFRKIYKIENIKRAFLNQDFHICRDLCRTSGLNDDDEINLILSRCSLGLAKENFSAGRLRSAGREFEEAVDYAESSIYNDDVARAEAVVYSRYMKRISQTLGIELSGREVCEGLSHGDLFCVYVSELEALELAVKTGEEKTIPDTKHEKLIEGAFAAHIGARKAMMKGEYSEAVMLLRGILTSVSRVPDPFLYSVFYDLEICSKETGDYRGAYEYSADKVNLLERMLSEVDA